MLTWNQKTDHELIIIAFNLLISKVQNMEIFYLVLYMYIKSARFQLENWDAQTRLGLAQRTTFPACQIDQHEA